LKSRVNFLGGDVICRNRQQVGVRCEKSIFKFNRTQIYADNRRNKKDAMRIALIAKRLSVYVRVQKGIS
jgi:hypothetical protein